MRKIVSLFLMFAMSMTMWATKTLYLVPNSNWTQANAKFAVYYFGGTGATTDGWSAIMETVANDSTTYTTTIPDGYPTVIFVRLNSTATEGSWADGVKWNQTENLTLPTDGKNMFTITEGDNWTAGTWGTYGQAPEPTPKFYATGDTALVVDAGYEAVKAWKADAIASLGDTLVLNLQAGKNYALKVVVDGNWEGGQVKGFSDLTAPVAEGLSADNDGNIRFTLNAAGAVNVIYNDSTFKVLGNFFVPEPVIADSVVVTFVNVPGWANVNLYAWNANGNNGWPGEAMIKSSSLFREKEIYTLKTAADYTNIIFNDGTNQTGDLTLDTTKLFFYDNVWYASLDSVPEPEPIITPNFYATGDTALVVDAGYDANLAWQANAIASYGDTLVLNLQAGKNYALKVVVDGNWEGGQVKGFSNLTAPVAEGLSADNDGNIRFTLNAAGAVNVIYNDSTFKVLGNFFVPEPVIADSVVVTFVNVPGWANVNLYAWNTNGNNGWPGEAMVKSSSLFREKEIYTLKTAADYTNIIFNDGTNQTGDLTLDTTKLFFYDNVWYASLDSVPEPEPIITPNFYATGDTALVVDAGYDANLAWQANAIASYGDTLVLNLQAGKNYALKVVVDGNWEGGQVKGFSNLTAPVAEGLSADKDGNIRFTLAEAGAVTVVYNDSVFTVTGNFVVPEPVENVKFYITGNVALVGQDKEWQPNAIPSMTDTFTLDLQANVDYILKVTVNGTWEGENNVKGYNELTEVTEGLQDIGNDHNIGFKLVEDGDVLVIYNDSTFKVLGNFFVPEPVETPKFYITGNAALVGQDKEWQPNAIPSMTDTFTLDLQANVDYILKVTVNGTWEGENNVKGYNELTEVTEGLQDIGNDHNIGFKLVEDGVVTVIYNATTFKVLGNFVTEIVPELPTVAIAGAMNSWSATANVMVAAEDGLTASVKISLEAQDYNFKVVVDGQWRCYPGQVYDITRENATLADVVSAGGDADNFNIKADVEGEYIFTWTYATNTLTITFPDAPITPDPKDTYFIKNNWNKGNWEWKQMTALNADSTMWSYSGVFGGTGVNINTETVDETAEWFAIDAMTVVGDLDPEAGDTVLFTYNVLTGILSAEVIEHPESALENVLMDSDNNFKSFENGVLYIYRNGVKYNANGQIIR